MASPVIVCFGARSGHILPLYWHLWGRRLDQRVALESSLAGHRPLAVCATIFAASRGLKDALIIILVAEAVLQGGYFVGLLIRFMVTAGMRSVSCSSFFKSRRDRKTHDNNQRGAPK